MTRLSRATLPALLVSGAIAAACVVPGQGSPSDDVGSTAAPIEGGNPINDGVDPLSSKVAMSTVGLTTPTTVNGQPGYAMCTGMILSATQILTAAHCQVGSTTIVYFYRTAPLGDGLDDQPDGALTTTGAPGASVVVPNGVSCTGPDPRHDPTCYSTWGAMGPGTATSHLADLAVLTIKDPITLAAPTDATGYRAVLIGASGSYTSTQATPGSPPPTWEVGTGKMNYFINACNDSTTAVSNPLRKMAWVPIYGLSAADSNPASSSYGYFYTQDAPFGDYGDSGGPVYQRQALQPGTPPPYNLFVVGLLSFTTKCTIDLPDGASVSTLGDLHQNVYTSLEYPDNYAWVVQQGGVGASGVPTFGAAQP